MNNTKTNENTTSENNVKVSDNRPDEKAGFQLPTLDQFMDIISGEKQVVTATASGYNVYNKYNKSS